MLEPKVFSLTLKSGLLLFSKVFSLPYVGGKVLVKRGFWALNSRLFRLCFKHSQITLRLTIHHPEMRIEEKGWSGKGWCRQVIGEQVSFLFLENFWLTFGTAAVDMKKLSPSFFFFLFPLNVTWKWVSLLLLCSKTSNFQLDSAYDGMKSFYIFTILTMTPLKLLHSDPSLFWHFDPYKYDNLSPPTRYSFFFKIKTS